VDGDAITKKMIRNTIEIIAGMILLGLRRVEIMTIFYSKIDKCAETRRDKAVW